MLRGLLVNHMTYCLSLMDSPAFFGNASDCGEPVKHDLRISAGDLDTANDAISAILITLQTDARAGDERGWWGDEFQPFPIGNTLWAQAQNGTTEFIVSQTEARIRAALAPLINRKVMDSLKVRVTRTIKGISAEVDALKGGVSIFKRSYNG